MFTLLVPVIILAVYLLFLRSLELSTVRNMLLDLNLPKELLSDPAFFKQIETVIDSWMLSGILGLSTVTVALQTNNVFVEDKQNGVNRDFASSPIHKNLLIGSYFFYNFIVSSLICLVFFGVCLIYLSATGEFFLSFADVLFILCVMFFGTVASTLMTVFLCSFVKSENTMMSLVAIFSTAVGFLIGAYMPLSMLPKFVQGFCGLIPGTYACSLLRFAFLRTPVRALTGACADLGLDPAIPEALFRQFGYEINFFGISLSPTLQAAVLGTFILLFLGANLLAGKNLSKIRDRG